MHLPKAEQENRDPAHLAVNHPFSGHVFQATLGQWCGPGVRQLELFVTESHRCLVPRLAGGEWSPRQAESHAPETAPTIRHAELPSSAFAHMLSDEEEKMNILILLLRGGSGTNSPPIVGAPSRLS